MQILTKKGLFTIKISPNGKMYLYSAIGRRCTSNLKTEIMEKLYQIYPSLLFGNEGYMRH